MLEKDIFNDLLKCSWIDLSHTVDENSPLWEGFPSFKKEQFHTHEINGFESEVFNHVGQLGTHIDAPKHFVKNGLALHEITINNLILPLSVINAVDKTNKNNNYELQVSDILDFENVNGEIPTNAFVAMRTDWSKRWPSKEKMTNIVDGVKHSPGWSVESIEWLCEHRNIAAIGHETIDTDSGIKSSQKIFTSELAILKKNKYQVELMSNLDLVKESGSVIIVCPPNFKDATGFPVRVIALTPN